MGDPRPASYVRTPQRAPRFRGFEEQQCQQQLLPGIADEVALDLITPKLHWTAVMVLPSISRVWKRAVQSREVYDARVRAQATEALVVKPFLRRRYSVRSLNDDTRVLIPGVSGCHSKSEPSFLWEQFIVAFDGKIYVLVADLSSSTSVFVLDLAAHKVWTECATVRQQRVSISPFISRFNFEVYDPETNVWSSINPVMLSKPRECFVAI